MSERTIFEKRQHWLSATQRVYTMMRLVDFEADTEEAIAFVQEMIADQANLLAQTAMDRAEIERLMNLIAKRLPT